MRSYREKQSKKSGQSRSWIVFRPPVGAIDKQLLHQRSHHLRSHHLRKLHKKSYHYTAAMNPWNGRVYPVNLSQISDQSICTTLNYSGYRLHNTRRHGVLDMITPRQAIDSWGVKNRWRHLAHVLSFETCPTLLESGTSFFSMGIVCFANAQLGYCMG